MSDPRYDYEQSKLRDKKDGDLKKFLEKFSSSQQETFEKKKTGIERNIKAPLAESTQYKVESSPENGEMNKIARTMPFYGQDTSHTFPLLEDLGKEVKREPQMAFPLKKIRVRKMEKQPDYQVSKPQEYSPPVASAPVKSPVVSVPAKSPSDSVLVDSQKAKAPINIMPPLAEEIPLETVSITVESGLSLHALFTKMISLNASDLHLTAGTSPVFRVNGDILLSNLPVLSNRNLEVLLYPILGEEHYLRFAEAGDLDFAIEVKNIARFRINYFRQHRGLSAVFRLIPFTPPEIKALGLPPVIKDIAESKKGLVIVTGPTGSGKTTTLAAMLHHMNKVRDAHIITIEDPLEFVHQNNKCLITHREVGTQASSFADALKAAIREDPDVILVGEMRDLETMDLAIKAAEMGFLVLTTLHTVDTARSIDRIINTFPMKQQEQIRLALSQTLRAIISQQLIKKKDLDGRYPAVEILLGTKALSGLIREGKTHQISSVIQTGADMGMQTMDQSLIELIRKNIINKETIRHKISDIKLFERAGIHFK